MAVPPDVTVQLAPDEARFIPGPKGDWRAFSLDAKVVTARAFDTAEVHLHARAAGETLVLLTNHAIQAVVFIRVRVGRDEALRAEPPPAKLRQRCGCRVEDDRLHCALIDGDCVAAVRDWIAGTGWSAKRLRLKYGVEGLQRLLRDMHQRLEAAGLDGIELAFSGANLRLRGSLPDRARWRTLLVELYRVMVGRILLEDETRIEAPESTP
jgi:hypothetical protein